MENQQSEEGNISMVDITKEASRQDSETPTVSLDTRHLNLDSGLLKKTFIIG